MMQEKTKLSQELASIKDSTEATAANASARALALEKEKEELKVLNRRPLAFGHNLIGWDNKMTRRKVRVKAVKALHSSTCKDCNYILRWRRSLNLNMNGI